VARIGKRRFYAALFISTFWLLGFAVVALAIGPDTAKSAERPAGLSSGVPASQLGARKLMPVPSGVADLAKESRARAIEDTERRSGIERIRTLAVSVKPAALAGVVPSAAANRASEWAKAVREAGGSPLGAIGEILPPPAWFQARLVHRRDEYDLQEAVQAGGSYGTKYLAVNGMLEQSRVSSGAVEAILDAVWHSDETPSRLKHTPHPILKKSERWLPSTSSLKEAHQYALDVFFTSVKRHGAAETGPVIRSMSSGIVVASSDDWKGGDKPSNYRSGGLSPKAGNGVIVYNPIQRRYYAYFHLSAVYAKTGHVISSGDTLGRGGNTGTNARQKAHGAHVHIEIHDAGGDAWSSYAIKDFVLSTY
jgi:murein DD-endopeptidase MepM/ murein hydrolase activator NlpD